MEKKTIVFNGETYIRSPKSRYYFKHTTKNAERKNAKQLHRAVWEYYNGEIPKGYHIHHIDGNVDNNDISNLECISAREHLSMHAKRNMQNEDYRERNKEQLLEAGEKAKEWHKSEEGREWHRKHSAQSILKASKHETPKICEFCGKEFLATKMQRFCCVSCEQKARRRRIGLKFTPYEKQCACCGNTFTAKSEKHKFCSPLCKQRYYARVQPHS